MADRGSSSSSRIRRRIEEYTPDGAVGRVLLSTATGTVSFFSFWFAFVGVVEPGLWPAVVALVFGTLFLTTGLLTTLLLWPVYLSLIGRIESTEAYSDALRDESSSEAPGAVDEGDADPVEVLKRRYAAGEVSESEFERRLGRLLGVEAVEEATRAAPDDPGLDRLTGDSGALRDGPNGPASEPTESTDGDGPSTTGSDATARAADRDGELERES